MPDQMILTGAHVICYVNGLIYGAVAELGWKSTTPTKPAHGLDCTEAHEEMPTTLLTSGNMRVYRRIQDGGAQGRGMAAPQGKISRQKYFSIKLVDRVTNTIIFRADQCSVQDEDWKAVTRAMMMGTLIFKALSWSNEVTANT